MPQALRRTIAGWGRFPAATTDLHRPERMSALRSLVAGDQPVLARGLGRAYGDAAINAAGRTVLVERLNRFLGFDPDSGVLECEAGVSIAEVLEVFAPRGFFPPVTPGTRHVTLGGAVACDVHGKNHHRDGSLSRHLVWLELLTASGALLRCSRTEHPDLFWATLGGMGLTGIITRVKLRLRRLESGHVLVDHDRARDLDEALRFFDESDARYHYSVAWIDCLARGRALGRTVLMRGNPAPLKSLRVAAARDPFPVPSTRTIGVPLTPPGFLLGGWSMRAFNAAYYHLQPRRAHGVLRSYESYFYPLDGVRDWNRLYGPRGFLQYQLVLPLARGREGLVRVLELLTSRSHGSFLAVLKRFGPTEPEQLLSFPRPGYTLALDLPRRDGVEDVLRRMDDIVVEHGGRVYLAKDARLGADAFRAMYPELPRWLAIKRRVDPANRFRSDLSRRLEMEP